MKRTEMINGYDLEWSVFMDKVNKRLFELPYVQDVQFVSQGTMKCFIVVDCTGEDEEKAEQKYK